MPNVFLWNTFLFTILRKCFFRIPYANWKFLKKSSKGFTKRYSCHLFEILLSLKKVNSVLSPKEILKNLRMNWLNTKVLEGSKKKSETSSGTLFEVFYGRKEVVNENCEKCLKNLREFRKTSQSSNLHHVFQGFGNWLSIDFWYYRWWWTRKNKRKSDFLSYFLTIFFRHISRCLLVCFLSFSL